MLGFDSLRCLATTPPGRQSPRLPVRTFSVRLWTFVNDRDVWSAEVQDRGIWGVEAQIRLNGRLHISRRFQTRREAIEWAAEEGLLFREKGVCDRLGP